MNLNSRLFDRIRVKPDRKPTPATDHVHCDFPGCQAPGEFRAPQGRLREGQYFNFCLDHVREYNASYNYFNGMSAEAVALYQREDLIGHRPTWAMGVNRSGKTFREEGDEPTGTQDPLGMFREGAKAARAQSGRADERRRPRHGVAVLKALDQLGLDEMADAAAVKTRYKDLVKRLHPDANGGDRSSEDRLREIIRAYNYLRSVKFV
ncbi:J domain-containing protein [Beijerinckia indica]|uniref:Heat shock protein DnaJ domain protein n=1 Tax=Beijerinckia indica subsp. indica (strain ATCC 9039 / DSM 1715 / NCIMB 8712) TaxID=395963 RepID=B2IEP5_BEII9|nr:DnaJ domain-containing protein [Beijerinckia indica]ACB96985.1 heat shock protein DnaJ domain protein [Beijerinckia indica subsp. indica ATCC 9039]